MFVDPLMGWAMKLPQNKSIMLFKSEADELRRHPKCLARTSLAIRLSSRHGEITKIARGSKLEKDTN